MNKKWPYIAAILALVISMVGMSLHAIAWKKQIRYGFVNTPILLNGFSETAKIQKEIQVERENWAKDLQVLKDSLALFESRASKEYSKASLTRKMEIKKEQITRLEEINRLEEAQVANAKRLEANKMKDLVAKINAALVEFGKTRGYDLIFGTTDGNILYGDGTRADLTAEFSQFLNERYR